MKVALIEASIPGRDRVFYPLGLAYLAGYLKRARPEISVRICRSLDELIEDRPDIAGISSVSPCFPRAIELAEAIKKESQIPVILGGAHISTMPRSLPEAFDAGAIGEGEKTFLDIVNSFTGGGISRESLLSMPGLVVRVDGEIRLTANRDQIADLDTIPFPIRDWTGISPQMQWLFSSRGCPYRCAFCSSSNMWKGYRAHSPEHVVSELGEIIERFDISLGIFMDDLFAVDVRRLRAIRDLLAEKIPEKIAYSVTLRAEIATPEICGILKDMGVSHVHLGLESGSDRILKSIKGSTSSVEINQRSLTLCHETGLFPVGSFIIGSPEEGAEELDETYDFIERNLKCGVMKSFSFSPMVPFPGTAIWDYAVTKGLLDPSNIDWQALDIDLENFSGEGYVLLTDRIGRGRFLFYFRKLKALYDEAVTLPTNT